MRKNEVRLREAYLFLIKLEDNKREELHLMRPPALSFKEAAEYADEYNREAAELEKRKGYTPGSQGRIRPVKFIQCVY